MLEIGRALTATVTSILPYGVYCESRGDSILVLANEMSWRGESKVDDVDIGDVLEVKIVDYNPEKKIYLGSCKEVRQEANPYIPFSRCFPTDIHCGVVRIVHKNGLSIQIGNCIGSLPYDDVTKEMVEGEKILVVIEKNDPTRQVLQLRVAGKNDKSEAASFE